MLDQVQLTVTRAAGGLENVTYKQTEGTDFFSLKKGRLWMNITVVFKQQWEVVEKTKPAIPQWYSMKSCEQVLTKDIPIKFSGVKYSLWTWLVTGCPERP